MRTGHGGAPRHPCAACPAWRRRGPAAEYHICIMPVVATSRERQLQAFARTRTTPPIQSVLRARITKVVHVWGEFWEMWEVTNGMVWIGTTRIPHRFDSFTFGGFGLCTKGSATIEGEVAFFSGYNWRLEHWHASPPSHPAGGLPIRVIAPTGWASVPKLKHRLRLEWRCCPGPTKCKISGLP